MELSTPSINKWITPNENKNTGIILAPISYQHIFVCFGNPKTVDERTLVLHQKLDIKSLNQYNISG